MSDVMGDWVRKVQEERAERGEVEVLDPAPQSPAVPDSGTVKDVLANLDTATDVQTKTLLALGRAVDAGMVSRPADLAVALRASSDAQAKAADTYLKLTGRAVGQQDGDMVALLRGLARDGLLKMNVALEIGDREDA